MACLEITCAKCRNVWFENQTHIPCPKCGNTENNHVWIDEEPDREDDAEEGEDDAD